MSATLIVAALLALLHTSSRANDEHAATPAFAPLFAELNAIATPHYTGGLPSRNPLFAEITASVLGAPVTIHGSEHGPAVGAAILAALAAGGSEGGFDDVSEAVAMMAGPRSKSPPSREVAPEIGAAKVYERLYPVYRKLAEVMSAPDSPMRRLS